MCPPVNLYSEYNEEQDEFYYGKHRLCPGCGVFAERIDGCNAINCPKCSLEWHWNSGIPNDGERVLHDYQKAAMHKDYEKTLKDKGFLKKFDVLESL